MRYGYCIFCDDIRTEEGEKLSFIGVYNGVMFLPELPLSLSKLCAHVTLVTPAGEPYRSIRLKCFGPGDDERPLIEEDLDTPQLDEQKQIADEVGSDPAAPVSIVVAASLIFSPLKIRRPGLLRVTAEIDGGAVEIGSLRVIRQ